MPGRTLSQIARRGLLQLCFFSPVSGQRVPADRSGWTGGGAAAYDTYHGTLDVPFWVEELGLVFVKVLSWVGGFVFESFHELVEAGGYESA